MQPPLFCTAYLPPIAYMALLSRYQQVLIEQCESFPKQTYRNRCVILTGNGLMTLSVHVVHTQGNHTLTSDMGITYAENWNIKHLRAIRAAYNASPYFLYYQDELESILMHPYDRLIDLNHALLLFLLNKMKIKTQVEYTTDFISPKEVDGDDYRYTITPKQPCPITISPYDQVFADRFPFFPNLSSLDLLFNLGPDSKRYLDSIAIQ